MTNIQDSLKQRFEFRTESSELYKILDRISHNGHDFGTIFRDWLDMIILSHVAISNKAFGKQDKFKKYDDEYISIIRKYKDQKIGEDKVPDLFAKALAELIIAMENFRGLDIIGTIYETFVSRGQHGQFFTPQHICGMMALMVNGGVKDDEKVSDPCCGSGRMLIESAKINPRAYFIGQDLDKVCCDMTAINLFFNGIRGEVRWGNSLALEVNRIYKIEPPFITLFEREEIPQTELIGKIIEVSKKEEVTEIVKRQPTQQLQLI